MRLTFKSLISWLALPSLAVLIGIVTAIACISFHLLIGFFTRLFFGIDADQSFIDGVKKLGDFERVLIPTVGGFLVGLLLTYLHVAEAEGEGVPQVLRAMVFKKSKINWFVAPVKIVTTALTLGSGGSAGREGPIVQIGSAIGSGVAQFFSLNESKTRLLLATGAAAGIGGTFGAPLAGVFFSLELLYRRVTFLSVLLFATAALVSDYIASRVLGYSGLRLKLPGDLDLGFEVIALSLIIGVSAGVVAIFFGKSINLSERLFHKLKSPLLVRTTIGGFLIGVIGLYLPYIHEPATYPLMIDLLVINSFPLTFLLILFFGKIIATSITIGSGGSGGVLAPSLLVGLVFGNILALLLGQLGILETSVAIYGLIAMASVFAGVTHAPLTATILLFEITKEPIVLLLVLFGSIISFLITKLFRAESVYTEHVKNRKIV